MSIAGYLSLFWLWDFIFLVFLILGIVFLTAKKHVEEKEDIPKALSFLVFYKYLILGLTGFIFSIWDYVTDSGVIIYWCLVIILYDQIVRISYK